MDIWDKEKRSAVMAKIRGKDTKPEWIVRRYLFAHGYRYRKNVKSLPGTPDIVLRKYGLVIFVHGCFWHGHGDSHIPHSRIEYWTNKIEANKKRDQRDKAELLRMGWNVLTIWECQLKPAVREQTLKEMEYLINQSYLNLLRKKAERKARRVKNIQAADNHQCIEEKSGHSKNDKPNSQQGYPTPPIPDTLAAEALSQKPGNKD